MGRRSTQGKWQVRTCAPDAPDADRVRLRVLGHGAPAPLAPPWRPTTSHLSTFQKKCDLSEVLTRVPFQLCLGSKGELCVDRTGGRGSWSLRTAAHPPLLVCAWKAFGEPHGRRQGESFPPVGTRGEVGNGVSVEPSSSLGKRICVEQAGEGRGVWRRSGKSTHQSKRLACSSQAISNKSKAVTL